MGQSGSIIKECEARGITLTRDACEIQFSSPDRVSQFGATAKGELEPNPDLAGQGVCCHSFYSTVEN
jgi:hypothetical protein